MLLLCITAFFASIFGQVDEVSVLVDQIGHSKGKIYLAIYNNAEGYMHPERVFRSSITELVASQRQVIDIGRLPDGDYAIVVFLDENGNGQLDKNWLGVPKERYGFSGAQRPLFRAPRWEEARVRVSGGMRQIRIVLR